MVAQLDNCILWDILYKKNLPGWIGFVHCLLGGYSNYKDGL